MDAGGLKMPVAYRQENSTTACYLLILRAWRIFHASITTRTMLLASPSHSYYGLRRTRGSRRATSSH